MHNELNEKFFKSLKLWINLSSKVTFIGDEKTKIELIVILINKFVFIQTLTDLGIIAPRWLKSTWDSLERRWHSKSKFTVLKTFLEQIDTVLQEYNIDMFKRNILEYVDGKEDNIALFYRNLKLILGLNEYHANSNKFRGIMHYNYRYIDEDIFGRAYETYLAENRRHERGIYYTPANITEFIVENTAGKVFDQLLAEIEVKMSEDYFEEVKRLTHKFIAIKILDPACGTGSFLIKALHMIRKKYSIFNQLIKKYEERYQWRNQYIKPDVVETKICQIHAIKDVLGTENESKLLSMILIRHLYGIDLDKNALNIAKANICLEAIKLASSQLKFDKRQKEVDYILPDLGINFACGNAVVGLHDEIIFEFFSQRRLIIRQFFEMRRLYLKDLNNPTLLENIEKIKSSLRKELDELFLRYLEGLNLTSDILEETIPLHWVLEFWHVFFEQDGAPLRMEDSGFDVVIGNPPYIDSETMTMVIPNTRQYCAKMYESCSGNWDMYCAFIEKGITRTKKGGYFSYIIPNKIISADYADATRRLLKRYKIEIFRDYSRVKVFDAAIYPIVLVLNKKPWNDKDVATAEVLLETDGDIPAVVQQYNIHLKDLYALQGHIWSLALDPALDIFSKIIANSSALKNYATIRGAATVSESYEIAEKLKEINKVKRSDYLKFINTGTIDKYASLWGIIPTRYIKKTYLRPVILSMDLGNVSERRLKDAKSEKIIIAGMGLDLECTYDNGAYLAGKSTVIVLTDRFNVKALVGILNSTLATFILRKMFGNLALRGGYVRIGPPQIREMPIPMTISNSEKIQKTLERLVDRIKTLKEWHLKLRENSKSETPPDIVKCDNETERLQAEIDAYIFCSYDLTQEEIETIMTSLSLPISYQRLVLEHISKVVNIFKIR